MTPHPAATANCSSRPRGAGPAPGRRPTGPPVTRRSAACCTCSTTGSSAPTGRRRTAVAPCCAPSPRTWWAAAGTSRRGPGRARLRTGDGGHDRRHHCGGARRDRSGPAPRDHDRSRGVAGHPAGRPPRPRPPPGAARRPGRDRGGHRYGRGRPRGPDAAPAALGRPLPLGRLPRCRHGLRRHRGRLTAAPGTRPRLPRPRHDGPGLPPPRTGGRVPRAGRGGGGRPRRPPGDRRLPRGAGPPGRLPAPHGPHGAADAARRARPHQRPVRDGARRDGHRAAAPGPPGDLRGRAAQRPELPGGTRPGRGHARG